MLRNLLYFSIAFSFLFLTPSSLASEKKKTLPKSFELKTMAGDKVTSGQFKNKYLAIQIWASWCVSCSKTMVDIAAIIDSEKLPIQFLALSVDEDLSSANAYFNKPDKSTFNTRLKSAKKFAYHDEGSSLSESLGIEAVPTVFLIAPNGDIERIILGHPTEKDFRFLRSLVQKKA